MRAWFGLHRLRAGGRLRLAMYLAFGVLTVAVGAQGLHTWQLERVRAADAELLERATDNRALALQLGQRAELLALDPGTRLSHVDPLARLLDESLTHALALEGLLDTQMRRSAETARHVGPALAGWQDQREKLWYRGQLLLRRLDDGDPEALRQAARALAAEAGPAAAAAQSLARRLRSATDDRSAAVAQELGLGLAALLLLLGLLSLAVVEPTARAVAANVGRLKDQALELRRLALVAENTTALVMITDAEGRLLWANAAFTQMSGWRLDEVTGQRPTDFLTHPDADPHATGQLRDALQRGAGIRQEWLHRTRDGHDLWLDVDLRPLHDGDGQLTGYVSVNTDVTGRVMQQAKLQALWNALPAGVVVRNADGRVVDANRAAERMVGLSLAQMQGLEPRDPRWRVLDENRADYPLRLHPALRTLASGQPARNETLGLRLPDDELRWLLLNTEPQCDAAGHVSGVITCFTDVTERRALETQLNHHAHTDALTQLPNRTSVMERLQQAIAHAGRHPGYGFALLFMDFDRFKQVNDTMGHAAGDELLRQIARRLQLALRPGDALARLEPPDAQPQEVAARIGGDEFVVVLEGVNSADVVSAIADRVLKEISEPYQIGCTPLHSSASIGVVLHLGRAGTADPAVPTITAEDVLRNADTAMYEAKRAGRGRWVLFDDSMHERVVRALALEADLRRALQADELFVVYQPVVDLGTRAMTGVEALVRWRHPERGLVSPLDFIQAAEESGLIDEVGDVVLKKACAQFVRWRQGLGDDAPAQLAVNLSRAQLKRAGMVQALASLLQACGMRPEWLQLEVTESLAAQDGPVQATLREIKALGVRLALDDFGTGYSSLACLHQLPVDTVKVDRSFVQHAQTVEYHRVLIEATIRVARTLGMTTVAEGIETEGQAALMQTLRCDRGQGYLYGRPMDAAALEAWVRAEAVAHA